MPSIEEARAWYSETDPIHGFDHVLRVYALAEYLARNRIPTQGKPKTTNALSTTLLQPNLPPEF